MRAASRLTRVGVSVSLGLLLGVGVWVWGTNDGEAQTDEPVAPGLTGAELADALGLEVQPSFPKGCYAYVEASESGEGYCLDTVGMTDLQAWDVGQRIRGHVPSELEWDIKELVIQINSALEAGDRATAMRLTLLLEELVTARDAAQ
jgi:hypothetical protein